MQQARTIFHELRPSLPMAGAEPDAVSAQPREHGFIRALESVRGIAALAVALFHSFHLLPVDGVRVYDQTLWNTSSTDALLMRLIMVPFNGGAAVSVFFVLSGFVLAISLDRDHRPPAAMSRAFIARRVFRIYPTLAVNILLMSALLAICSAAIPLAPPSLRQVMTNLTLRDFPVNGATWSLMIELAAIPFLLVGYFAARRWGNSGLIALIAMGIATLFVKVLLFKMLIAEYIFMFFLGMLVAEHWMSRRTTLSATTARMWLVASIAVLMSARFIVGYTSRWSLLLEGFASAAMIAALVLGPRLALHGVLEMKPFRFLGRISYSYYLYHPLALGIFVPALMAAASPGWLQAHPFLGSCTIAIVTVVATLPLAYGSFLLTEKPMIRLSHRF